MAQKYDNMICGICGKENKLKHQDFCIDLGCSGRMIPFKEGNLKDNVDRLFEIHKELQDAVSTTIKIDHGQVLDIVVKDLVSKYKACKERGDEYEESFKKVLRFYLTEDELEERINT